MPIQYSLTKNFGFWVVSTLKRYRSLTRPQQALPSAKPRHTSHRVLKSVLVFAVGDDKKKGKERYKKSQSRYISRNRREAPCERILTKFRTSRDVAGGHNYLCQM